MTTTKKPTKKAAPKSAPKAKATTAPKAKQADAPKKTGACARVHAIADSMKDAARKDVIAACIKAGLNKATASTQYQKWTHRGDK